MNIFIRSIIVVLALLLSGCYAYPGRIPYGVVLNGNPYNRGYNNGYYSNGLGYYNNGYYNNSFWNRFGYRNMYHDHDRYTWGSRYDNDYHNNRFGQYHQGGHHGWH